eukprot:4664842-Prymnesium_polylepis.1
MASARTALMGRSARGAQQPLDTAVSTARLAPHREPRGPAADPSDPLDELVGQRRQRHVRQRPQRRIRRRQQRRVTRRPQRRIGRRRQRRIGRRRQRRIGRRPQRCVGLVRHGQPQPTESTRRCTNVHKALILKTETPTPMLNRAHVPHS